MPHWQANVQPTAYGFPATGADTDYDRNSCDTPEQRETAIPLCSNPVNQKQKHPLRPLLFLAGAEGFDFSAEKPFAGLTAHRAVIQDRSVRILSIKKQKHPLRTLLFLAGAEGFEPSTKVLETHVLPLHHAPIATAIAIIGRICLFVKNNFREEDRSASDHSKAGSAYFQT